MSDAFNLGTAIVGPTVTTDCQHPDARPWRHTSRRIEKTPPDVEVVRTGGDLSSPYVLRPGEAVNLMPGDLQKVSLLASVAGQRVGWHTR